jgi:hypothetical protein
MAPTVDFTQDSPVSELAIVDTFTKLIFGEEDDYSVREMLIIQAFRQEDTHVALDTHRDMGQYLRALGVREMVRLVSAVQQRLDEGVQLVAAEAGDSVLKHRPAKR